MNNVLILGASGLLGKSLVKHFLSKNFLVGALSRQGSSSYHKGLTSYKVDVLEYEKLESIISEYNLVVNCIGQITNPISDCMVLNTKGIQNIIDAVKKSNAYLVHISTVSVYGSCPTFINEQQKLNPESLYGGIKSFSEFLIKNNLENYSILRVSNLYGQNQKKGILGYIVRSVLEKKKELFFNNDGSLKRYYLHIDDLSSIIEQILVKKLLGIYNVIGEDFFTIKELVSLCEEVFDYKFIVHYEEKKPIENIESIDDRLIKTSIEPIFKYSIKKYLKEYRS